MRTHALGNSDELWSVIGLGSWAIGGPWARGWGHQNDSESIAAIHRALDAGVNWIDTAAVYGNGHAETVIARALEEHSGSEKRPLVLTKCGRVEMPDGTVRSMGAASSVRESAHESLARLGQDQLDMMQMHWPPTDVPLVETWTAIAELRSEGLAKRIGASNVDLEQLLAIREIAEPDVVQIPISLVRRESLAELLPFCAEAGIGVIAYAPMQSGLLTGKYDATRIADLSEGDWRKQDPEFNGERLQRNLKIVAALQRVASAREVTAGEIAIAWVLSLTGVTGAIVGGRSADQVDGWIGAAEIELTDAELDEIGASL